MRTSTLVWLFSSSLLSVTASPAHGDYGDHGSYGGNSDRGGYNDHGGYNNQGGYGGYGSCRADDEILKLLRNPKNSYGASAFCSDYIKGTATVKQTVGYTVTKATTTTLPATTIATVTTTTTTGYSTTLVTSQIPNTLTTVTSTAYTTCTTAIQRREVQVPYYLNGRRKEQISSACSCLVSPQTTTTIKTVQEARYTTKTSTSSGSRTTTTSTSTSTTISVETDTTTLPPTSTQTSTVVVTSTTTVPQETCKVGFQAIKNPGFESPPISDAVAPYWTYTDSTQKIIIRRLIAATPTTPENTNIAGYRGYYPYEGKRHFYAEATSGNSNITISQEISNLCPGATYTLTFHVGVHAARNTNPDETFVVKLDGETVYGPTSVCGALFELCTSQANYVHYRTVTIDYVAVASTDYLDITFNVASKTTYSSLGNLLDKVTLTYKTDPEPSET